MYYSKVKPQFRNNIFTDKDYRILFDVDDEKVMLYDEDRFLLYDLYKNKLESPQKSIPFATFKQNYKMILVAKREQYVVEYNLDGLYNLNNILVKYKRDNSGLLTSSTNLEVQKFSSDVIRYIFPSRFRVYKLIDLDTDEVIGGSQE